jgi:four helix bundle protein
MLTSYRDLDAWNRSLALVVDVYRVTSKLPAAERFGLTAQMRRAAVSVSCNIAEGYGRATRGEYLNHLSMARGSVNEVEALCEVCKTLDLLGEADLVPIRAQLTKVRQLLGRLREALRRRPELKSRKTR